MYLQKSWSYKRREALFGIILIMPLLVWLLITVGYPLFLTFQVSFLNIDFIGKQGSYIGLKNFIEIFKEANFWSAAKRSLMWTVGNMLIQTILGFFAALLLNSRLRLARLMRSWVILPWILPTVVIAIMWRWMLSGTFGVINYLLVSSGVINKPINFLGSIQYSMWTLIVINSWRWFPFITVLLFAGLQSIPEEQYEAASIDGANSIQRFRYITLPNLSPIMTVMGVLGPLLSFNVFDIIWMLTQGGPSRVSQTVPLLIYERGFKAFSLSEASAMSVISFAILLVFVSVYIKFTKLDVSEYTSV